MADAVVSGTLQVKRPIGRTVGLALLLLAILVASLEGLARLETVQARLPYPSVGSPHRVFEVRLALLNQLVEAQSPVDCIFLGSSMAGAAVDPEIFSQAFRERTGEDIGCFNFGVLGLTASSAQTLAGILAREYHPKLLVYATSPRDYVQDTGRETAAALDIPWVHHHNGEFAFQGWLVDRSYAYRYFLTFRNWMSPDYQQYIDDVWRSKGRYSVYGYSQWNKVAEDIHLPPEPDAERAFFAVMSDYAPSQPDLEGLETILEMGDAEMQVLIVEAPVHPTYLYFFDNGEQDYQKFIDQVGDLAASHEILFWPTTLLEVVPDEGWANRNHLNTDGAAVFSRWLGEQTGEAVVAGDLADPVH